MANKIYSSSNKTHLLRPSLQTRGTYFLDTAPLARWTRLSNRVKLRSIQLLRRTLSARQ